MSLKIFHIVFIALSTLLAGGFGFWAAEQNETRGGWYLAASAGGFLVAVALMAYGVWFYGKIRRMER